MPQPPFEDTGAQTIRTHWFRYLDTVEPIRKELYGYCHKLTGNVWDAEDLVQDTLLKGFGMTARGDFHGESSPVRNVKAYLFRTATNAWIDICRAGKSVRPFSEEQVVANDPDPVETADAIGKALSLGSPQEFASILLKDVYGFSLDEIADFIGTTPGTVKSALSRARKKMQEDIVSHPVDPELKDVVNKFVDAINANDADQVVSLMVEQVQIQVCNVGGGRGRHGNWTEKTIGHIVAEYAEHDGVPVVLLFKDNAPDELYDVLRLQSDDQMITRIIDYCYAPETLAHVADARGYRCNQTNYHQPWEIITGNMVPTTALPWRE